MTSKSRIWLAAAVSLALFGSIPARGEGASSGAQVKEKGDLWEVTSRMSMEGMDIEMPATKAKVCTPKTWTEPPAAENQQQKCTNSDFHVDGPKATWKITCEPPNAMTGTGEITRDGDAAYSGTMKLASAHGNMTMKLDGRRVGECDKPRK